MDASSFQKELYELASRHGDDGLPPWTAALDEREEEDEHLGGTGTWLGLGMRRSLAAPLGEELWTLDPTLAEETRFTAAIYRTEFGQRIGLIRIPRYLHDPRRAELFGEIIRRFENETDALLLDQQYNPGGSLLQMYALCSHLTDRPLPVPLHQVKLWDNDVPEAKDVLDRLSYGEELPMEDRPNMFEVAWARFVLDHAKLGKGVLSDPVPLFGIAEIEPAPHPYTKPIFLLSNEVTFSAGEFLAAILKDNSRATLLGANTAGAGGCARAFDVTGLLNFRMTMTWTVGWRRNGMFIENCGISPDFQILPVPEDITSDYARLRNTLRFTIACALHEPRGISVIPQLRGKPPS